MVRIPNTLTAVADIFAGASLAQHHVMPLPAFLALSLASVAFYWAGMVLNDVFDVEEDTARRRPRPIVQGEVSLELARKAGWFLLGIGCFLAAIAPWFTGVKDIGSGLIPVGVAVALGLSIVAYDGWFKSLWIAPWIMGICRALNIGLGATIASSEWRNWESNQWMSLGLLMLGHFLYVSGFTWAARREAVQSKRSMLIFGWSICFLGVAAFASVPAVSSHGPLYMDPYRWYPILIAMLCFPLARRAWVACVSLQPMAVQASIKQAIMTIILLDASVSLEFAGSTIGSICCLMILPSLWMGTWFRST